MGKASRWIINVLLGRKEEKERKKQSASFEEIEETSSGFWPSTPIIKRRWSFGRSSSKQKAHKSTKSFDLMNTNPVVKQAILDLQNQQNHINNMALVVANTATARKVVNPKPATYRISREAADAAATKIQAVFRSYLARKALYALRGLVKLQALVRGHQVRKKTTATLRQMHALMAIQVRARFQRIQMAEESQLVVKSQSARYRKFPQENEFRRAHTGAIDRNLYETHEVSKSKYGYLNHSQIDRIEHGVTRYFSRQLSISRQEHHQYEEFSFSAQNTPRNHRVTCNKIPGRVSFSYQQPDHAHPGSHDFSFQRNYMANTESSTAKARSQSEPKQRPERNVRTERKRKASLDGTTGFLAKAQSQHSSPLSKHINNENQDPRFIGLYQKKRVVKDEDSDANSTRTSRSSYCNSLLAYEPHVNIY